jgi:lipopolysaccharide heptosyltransferase I
MPRTARPKLCEYHAERVALIKPSALGDIIHTLPVLSALRRRYPQAHITWIVNRTYEPLLRGHPDLDETLPFDRSLFRAGWVSGMQAWWTFLGELRRQRYDLVLDLQGLLRSGLLTAAMRAPRRVGFASAREGAPWFYTDRLPGGGRHSGHAVDRYWRVAEALGVGDSPVCFRVPVPEDARRWAAEALYGYPRPWIFLGVGARWRTKRWPPAHFAALAARAQVQYGGTAVFVGRGDEAPLAQATAAALPGPSRDLTDGTTLPQLAAVLSLADVMIANDTGPLHLAVALGRPVVAPYTCTSIQLTGPYGTAAAGAVETRVWCQGSYLRRCSRLDCMHELTPDRLWPHLERFLLQWQNSCRSA